MKVEEIKLALDKNRETHVQFSLAQDLQKKADETRAVIKKIDEVVSIVLNNLKTANNLKTEFLNKKKDFIATEDLVLETSNRLGINANSILQKYADVYKSFVDVDNKLKKIGAI